MYTQWHNCSSRVQALYQNSRIAIKHTTMSILPYTSLVIFYIHTIHTWHGLGWWCWWFSRREVSDVSLIGGGDGRWVRDLQLKHHRFSKFDTITIVQRKLITE